MERLQSWFHPGAESRYKMQCSTWQFLWALGSSIARQEYLHNYWVPQKRSVHWSMENSMSGHFNSRPEWFARGHGSVSMLHSASSIDVESLIFYIVGLNKSQRKLALVWRQTENFLFPTSSFSSNAEPEYFSPNAVQFFMVENRKAIRNNQNNGKSLLPIWWKRQVTWYCLVMYWTFFL